MLSGSRVNNVIATLCLGYITRQWTSHFPQPDNSYEFPTKFMHVVKNAHGMESFKVNEFICHEALYVIFYIYIYIYLFYIYNLYFLRYTPIHFCLTSPDVFLTEVLRCWCIWGKRGGKIRWGKLKFQDLWKSDE